MNWLICWMSKRALERSAPMTSSTSRRLPQKTCGLFDTGFAGGALDTTSLDLNAQAVLTSAQDPLADAFGDLFEADAFTESVALPFADDALGLKKLPAPFEPETTAAVELEPVTPLIQEWDALAGLGTNKLSEDSLDAFINLDHFLSRKDFLEDENDVAFDDKTNTTMQLESHVEELQPEFLNLNFLELEPVALNGSSEVAPPNTEVSSTTTCCTAKTKKALKRKAKQSAGPVKTSMFEIEATRTSSSSSVTTVAHTVDHDYTPKRQKIQKTLASNKKGKRAAATSLETSNSSSVWSTDLLLSDSEACITSTSSAPAVVDKQAIRRMKNNVASKRSREQRKQKFAEMDEEAEELIAANAKLREKIVELENMAKEMKAVLVAKMAGAK